MSNFEENLSKHLPVKEFVEKTSLGKAEDVVQRLRGNDVCVRSVEGVLQEAYDAILACDTVIHFEGAIIGKPRDAQDAVKTLKRLRNKVHSVFTGVTLAFPDGTFEVFSEETRVQFGDYSDETIATYVATGEPL